MTLLPDAAARFATFAANASVIDIRVNGRRLATPRLVGPLRGMTTFSLGRSQDDEHRLRTLLAPLADKTTWR